MEMVRATISRPMSLALDLGSSIRVWADAGRQPADIQSPSPRPFNDCRLMPMASSAPGTDILFLFLRQPFSL